MKFIEEAEDLLVAPKPQAATAAQVVEAPVAVQPTATAVQTATPITVASIGDADDDFDSTSVSTALAKVKVTPGQVARVALLGPVASGFRHFHEPTKSYIQCTSERDPNHPARIIKQGNCCLSLQEAKWARVALVVQYLGVDAASGKITAPGWRIASIVVPGPGWAALKNIVPEGSKLTAIDIKVSARTNGFGNDFNLQSTEAAYLKSAETVAKVNAAAEPLIPHLSEKLGKRFTDMQLKAVINSGKPASDELDDLSDIG
jgi:hypothetical protein